MVLKKWLYGYGDLYSPFISLCFDLLLKRERQFIQTSINTSNEYINKQYIYIYIVLQKFLLGVSLSHPPRHWDMFHFLLPSLQYSSFIIDLIKISYEYIIQVIVKKSD